MTSRSTLDKVRDLFRPSDAEANYYEPLAEERNEDENGSTTYRRVSRPTLSLPDTDEPSFSWFEYSIFLLLGIAMLWAW